MYHNPMNRSVFDDEIIAVVQSDIMVMTLLMVVDHVHGRSFS
jgi:hypothetical protein